MDIKIDSIVKDRDESTLENYFDKASRELNGIFNISLGVIFLDYRKKSILFANDYFHSIVKDKKKDILGNIYSYIDQNINGPKELSKNQQVIIIREGKGMELGFTAFRINDNIVLVFLRPIASRSIYLESKQKSQFYDKWSELVAEMAHEIGNPLSGINTSLQVMLHNITTWPMGKIKDYIERTITEINRLSNFLKKIREVSRDNILDIKPTNLRNVTEKVLLQNEELLKQKKISYYNMINKDTNVLIDEEAFLQIILNLINNSLQMLTPYKQIKIYEEEIDDPYVKLVYRNNGPPIPEELMEKIFSPVYSTKDRGGGIGLAISLKLITRMGGTMKAVPPEDGIGAKFLLYIPH